MSFVPCGWRIERRREALASLDYECVRGNRIYSTKGASIVLEVEDPGAARVKVLYRTLKGNYFQVGWKKIAGIKRGNDGYYQFHGLKPLSEEEALKALQGR